MSKTTRKQNTKHEKRQERQDTTDRNKGKHRNERAAKEGRLRTENSEESCKDQQESSDFNKFGPRKVVTNLDRFKEIAEDETEFSRGEDLEHLLKHSTGTDSHFKFKDETDWEGIEDHDDVCDFLRIDCNGLRAALDTIPLHKRLNISANVFLASDVEIFEKFAAQKRAAVLQKMQAASDLKTRIIAATKPTGMTPGGESIAEDLEDELEQLLSLTNQQPIRTLEKLGCRSTSLEDLLDIALETE